MSRIIITASTAVGAPRRVLLRLLPIILGLTVLCVSVPSYGGEAAPGPDFNGFWRRPSFSFVPPYLSEIGRFRFEVTGGHKSPILKPWAAEVVMANLHGRATGRPPANSNTACWPEGVPAIYSIGEMQILQQPDKITILYTDDQAVRHIYLNESHPNPLPRSWYGHSVAHFEGDTLVVDTYGFHNRVEAMIDHYGTPASDGLHIVERFHMLNDGNRLQVDFTADDPNTFKTPWSMTIDYDTREGHLAEYRCAENNRDWPDLAPMAERPDF
jgi:hypothetical protein